MSVCGSVPGSSAQGVAQVSQESPDGETQLTPQGTQSDDPVSNLNMRANQSKAKLGSQGGK